MFDCKVGEANVQIFIYCVICAAAARGAIGDMFPRLADELNADVSFLTGCPDVRFRGRTASIL